MNVKSVDSFSVYAVQPIRLECQVEGIRHDIVATDERVYGKKCPFVEIGIVNRFPIGNGISLHKKICIHTTAFSLPHSSIAV